MSVRKLAALGASAAALAACGSPPPSLVQLRAQGTRICAGAGQLLGGIATPRSEPGAAAFLKHGIGVLHAELRRLRALRAPTEAADVYRAALDSLSNELSALNGSVRALARGDDPVIAFRALQQRLGPLEEQADNAWRALQIPACLQD